MPEEQEKKSLGSIPGVEVPEDLQLHMRALMGLDPQPAKENAISISPDEFPSGFFSGVESFAPTSTTSLKESEVSGESSALGIPDSRLKDRGPFSGFLDGKRE